MDCFEPKILHYESLPSTNTEAARLAVAGAAEGLTVVANEQTAGRGRLQRNWVSPAGAGLYLSCVLRPKLPLDRWPLITFAAAVAVNRSLSQTAGVVTDIKWPNDILAGERKICGILAESFDTSLGKALILGIGVNLTQQAFPAELCEVATSVQTVTGVAPSREEFVSVLLAELGSWYSLLQSDGGVASILKAWSERSSYVTGKSIIVQDDNESFAGITCGLEPDGALRVKTAQDEIRIVRAADIKSLRSST